MAHRPTQRQLVLWQMPVVMTPEKIKSGSSDSETFKEQVAEKQGNQPPKLGFWCIALLLVVLSESTTQ